MRSHNEYHLGREDDDNFDPDLGNDKEKDLAAAGNSVVHFPMNMYLSIPLDCEVLDDDTIRTAA
jgi:hypothetical protein